jgi:tetratricopeptide (TPR) repeat protein
LAWADARGDAAVLCRIAASMSFYWLENGRLNEARGWLDRALAVAEAVPPPLRAAVVRAAGWGARYRGDLGAAEALGRHGLALSRDLGDGPVVVDALSLLGFVAEDLGDFARSKALHEEALALAQSLDYPLLTGRAMRHVGWLTVLAGDAASAEPLLEEALARFRRDGARVLAALVLSDLAEIALLRGDHARAAAAYQERLHLSGDGWHLRWSLEGLATIAAACGEAERAARLFGAAEALRERLGVVLVPRLAEYAATVAPVRAALGEAAFAAAWATGRAMTPAEARAEAARVTQGDGPPVTGAAGGEAGAN